MRRNIDLYRFESFSFSGVLRDSAGVVDLTSATLTWRVGSTDGRTTKLTLTEGDGITVDEATDGTWTITIDPGDVDDLEPGYYTHQGKAVIGSTTYLLVQGRFRLRRDLPE
jgi:hypothetical protein